ncbi:MAG: hypothetical protein IKE94_09445 [Aeriscardovia sp.]|nr:hypothetical protein [Aeriscardovia sp.]
MSYYYDYYIGYKYNGKIYPWGVYDAKGRIHPAVSKSRSFASDLHERFSYVKEEEFSDELRKEFEYEYWDSDKRYMPEVKWLSINQLPSTDYIKRGYCLISDVKAYEEDRDWFEGFYDVISPNVYAALLDKELKFGKNQPQKDCEGEEYTEPNASDYMFYAYPDYKSEEYESFLIISVFDSIESFHMPEGIEWIVLETEG